VCILGRESQMIQVQERCGRALLKGAAPCSRATPKGQDTGLGGPKLIQQSKPNNSNCTNNPRSVRPPSSVSQMRGGAHAWPHEAWVAGIACARNQTATPAAAAAGSLRSKAVRRQQGCQPRREGVVGTE
jgi:hypothetical protein